MRDSPQTYFISLPDALYSIVGGINKNGQIASIEAILILLKKHYAGMTVPRRNILQDTLNALVMDGRLCATGKGYLISPLLPDQPSLVPLTPAGIDHMYPAGPSGFGSTTPYVDPFKTPLPPPYCGGPATAGPTPFSAFQLESGRYLGSSGHRNKQALILLNKDGSGGHSANAKAEMCSRECQTGASVACGEAPYRPPPDLLLNKPGTSSEVISSLCCNENVNRVTPEAHDVDANEGPKNDGQADLTDLLLNKPVTSSEVISSLCYDQNVNRGPTETVDVEMNEGPNDEAQDANPKQKASGHFLQRIFRRKPPKSKSLDDHAKLARSKPDTTNKYQAATIVNPSMPQSVSIDNYNDASSRSGLDKHPTACRMTVSTHSDSCRVSKNAQKQRKEATRDSGGRKSGSNNKPGSAGGSLDRKKQPQTKDYQVQDQREAKQLTAKQQQRVTFSAQFPPTGWMFQPNALSPVREVKDHPLSDYQNVFEAPHFNAGTRDDVRSGKSIGTGQQFDSNNHNYVPTLPSSHHESPFLSGMPQSASDMDLISIAQHGTNALYNARDAAWMDQGVYNYQSLNSRPPSQPQWMFGPGSRPLESTRKRSNHHRQQRAGGYKHDPRAIPGGRGMSKFLSSSSECLSTFDRADPWGARMGTASTRRTIDYYRCIDRTAYDDEHQQQLVYKIKRQSHRRKVEQLRSRNIRDSGIREGPPGNGGGRPSTSMGVPYGMVPLGNDFGGIWSNDAGTEFAYQPGQHSYWGHDLRSAEPRPLNVNGQFGLAGMPNVAGSVDDRCVSKVNADAAQLFQNTNTHQNAGDKQCPCSLLASSNSHTDGRSATEQVQHILGTDQMSTEKHVPGEWRTSTPCDPSHNAVEQIELLTIDGDERNQAGPQQGLPKSSVGSEASTASTTIVPSFRTTATDASTASAFPAAPPPVNADPGIQGLFAYHTNGSGFDPDSPSVPTRSAADDQSYHIPYPHLYTVPSPSYSRSPLLAAHRMLQLPMLMAGNGQMRSPVSELPPPILAKPRPLSTSIPSPPQRGENLASCRYEHMASADHLAATLHHYDLDRFGRNPRLGHVSQSKGVELITNLTAVAMEKEQPTSSRDSALSSLNSPPIPSAHSDNVSSGSSACRHSSSSSSGGGKSLSMGRGCTGVCGIDEGDVGDLGENYGDIVHRVEMVNRDDGKRQEEAFDISGERDGEGSRGDGSQGAGSVDDCVPSAPNVTVSTGSKYSDDSGGVEGLSKNSDDISGGNKCVNDSRTYINLVTQIDHKRVVSEPDRAVVRAEPPNLPLPVTPDDRTCHVGRGPAGSDSHHDTCSDYDHIYANDTKGADHLYENLERRGKKGAPVAVGVGATPQKRAPRFRGEQLVVPPHRANNELPHTRDVVVRRMRCRSMEDLSTLRLCNLESTRFENDDETNTYAECGPHDASNASRRTLSDDDVGFASMDPTLSERYKSRDLLERRCADISRIERLLESPL